MVDSVSHAPDLWEVFYCNLNFSQHLKTNAGHSFLVIFPIVCLLFFFHFFKISLNFIIFLINFCEVVYSENCTGIF